MLASLDPTGPEVARVERAVRYLARNRLEQPGLDAVADVMGLSPFHAQRVFSGVVGVSPKQLLGLLTVEHAKALLRRDDESVLGAALEVGLSGPSRLHDLFVKVEAITPGEYRAEGRGLVMRWGVHPTPFGDALFVLSDRGLARLAFVADAGPAGALAEARADWPLSTFAEDRAGTAPCAAGAFAGLAGRSEAPIRLLVKGSPFQVQVWRALVRVPRGAAVSYGVLARALGAPGAARAVGSACGRNRIGYLIPCHRVVREGGDLGGYHWGPDLKRSLLAAETEAAAVEGGRP